MAYILFAQGQQETCHDKNPHLLAYFFATKRKFASLCANMHLYNKVHQRIERLWWQEKKPWLGMRALAAVYHRINQYNLNLRVQKQKTPPIPLISVGNITVGGSGKTPFVVWLSTHLKKNGWQPVVVCRGDGGTSPSLRHVQANDRAVNVGDEAKMLAQQCHCPVIRGQDRVQASLMAATMGNVMILDDGFQYRQLKAALKIVLVPHLGVGNGCMLPAGPMREPLSALQRADIVVRTGGKEAAPLCAQKEWWWLSRPSQLHDVQTFQTARPKQVFALTSIARPQRFIESLADYGLNVVKQDFFPDHHSFNKQDVQTALSSGFAIVVTAKDAVKLLDIWPEKHALWVLGQEADCEQGLLEKIDEHMLRAKMENHHVG